MRLLISHAADPGDGAGNYRTELRAAARGGSAETVQELTKQAADVDDAGNTGCLGAAFGAAGYACHTDVSKALKMS